MKRWQNKFFSPASHCETVWAEQQQASEEIFENQLCCWSQVINYTLENHVFWNALSLSHTLLLYIKSKSDSQKYCV